LILYISSSKWKTNHVAPTLKMEIVSIPDLPNVSSADVKNVFHENGIARVTRVDIIKAGLEKSALVHVGKWYLENNGFTVLSELSHNGSYCLSYTKSGKTGSLVLQVPGKVTKGSSSVGNKGELESLFDRVKSLERKEAQTDQRLMSLETKWCASPAVPVSGTRASSSASSSRLVEFTAPKVPSNLSPDHVCVDETCPRDVFIMVTKIVKCSDRANPVVATPSPRTHSLKIEDKKHKLTVVVRFYEQDPPSWVFPRPSVNTVIEFKMTGNAERGRGWVNTVRRHLPDIAKHVGREDFVEAGVEPMPNFFKPRTSPTCQYVQEYESEGDEECDEEQEEDAEEEDYESEEEDARPFQNITSQKLRKIFGGL
jgi:hypothetical protein